MTGESQARTDDIRWRAAERVMRKSLAAVQRYAEQAQAVRSYREGLLEEDPGADPDAALVAETERALEQARAALEELGEK